MKGEGLIVKDEWHWMWCEGGESMETHSLYKIMEELRKLLFKDFFLNFFRGGDPSTPWGGGKIFFIKF